MSEKSIEFKLCPQCRTQLTVVGDFLICPQHGPMKAEEALSPEKSFLPRFVFISYGRDEHAVFARRLRDDLRSRGHEAWFDEERLKEGGDWERFIEEGLDKCAEDPDRNALLLLMTPHSVRRPDGYCLNEIARAVMRGIRIIPVMVADSEPPLSISRIQWLDMRRCMPFTEKGEAYTASFERLLKALEEGAIDFEGTQSYLLHHLQPLEFEAEVMEHSVKFTGRDWVFREVDQWLASSSMNKPASRVFWIAGAPGSGKTAIAARLSEQYRESGGIHFCRFNHIEKGDPRRVVTSLAYQLSTQIPEYHARLAKMNFEELRTQDAGTLFDNLFVQPLHGLRTPDRPVVLLIDALDEVTRDGKNELAGFIGDQFHKTPQWLRLIVTSRPESAVASSSLQRYSPFELNLQSEENRADLEEYLARELAPHLEGRSGKTKKKLLDEIIARSEGVFLYAASVCEEIAQGKLVLDRIDDFPRGLGGIYSRYFERQFPDREQFDDEIMPALEVILAAREPLPVSLLREIMGWKEKERRKRLDRLSSFFPVKGSKEEEVVSVYHKTLADWLTDEERAGDYWVSPGEGHLRLGEYGLALYQNGGIDSLPPYFLHHLPAHLMAKKRFKETASYLSSPAVFRKLCPWDGDYRTREGVGSWWRVLRDNGFPPGEWYKRTLDAMTPEEDASRTEAALELASFCNELGVFFRNTLQEYEEALPIHQRALAIREKLLGPDHPDTASSLFRLANYFYTVTSDYKKAEELYKRVIGIREKALGPDDPETANALMNLGVLKKKLGAYDEAQELFERALAIREKAFGPEHPDTAASLIGIANLHQERGDYDKALELRERALAIREKALGPEHPDTAASLNGLANLHQHRGDYDKALELRERALAIREKALGPEHPDTAVSLNGLANLHQQRGDYDKALELRERALAIREKAFGPEHPDTAASLIGIANLYQQRGDYDKALELRERALAIREKALGPEHPDTAASLNGLANLHQQRGDYDKALELLERDLAISEKALGPEHPDTAASLNGLANLYQQRGDYDKALELFERDLAISEKTLGPEHPDTATSLICIANLQKQRGDYDKALELYERAHAIREKVFGPEHPDTAASLSGLANLHQDRGDYDKALSLKERSLALYEKALGPEHPKTADRIFGIAFLYKESAEYAKAEPFFERALSLHEKAFGQNHPDTANTLYEFALLRLLQGDLERAEPMFLKSLEVRQELRGLEHRNTAESMFGLGLLREAQGNYAEARALQERALAIREKLFGSRHLLTAESLHHLGALHSKTGEYDRALAYLEKALAVREQVLRDHPKTAETATSLADLQELRGDSAEAERLRERVEAIAARRKG